LVVVVELAIVLLVAYLVYSGVTALTGRRRPRLPAVGVGGRWQTRHYADDGHTVVAVARMTPAGEVLEDHVVARIHDSDDDWSRKFLRAKEEAEERAFHLNAGGQP
jgi:pyridoxamine 5'-phosphate oxidase family protein